MRLKLAQGGERPGVQTANYCDLSIGPLALLLGIPVYKGHRSILSNKIPRANQLHIIIIDGNSQQAIEEIIYCNMGEQLGITIPKKVNKQ